MVHQIENKWVLHPELFAKAKEMWESGLSGTQIATTLATMGHYFTRQAVIGKMWREGIRSPRTRSNEEAFIKRRLELARIRAAKPPIPAFIPVREAPPMAPMQKEAPPCLPLLPFSSMERVHNPEDGCDIYQLENNSCRFPLGATMDHATRFCGKQHGTIDLVGGKPYCSDHAKRAYVPQRKHRSSTPMVFNKRKKVNA
jgi:hypothetical protein